MTFKALLLGIVNRSAAILSFQDVFFTTALIAFCGGLLALLIRKNTIDPVQR